jgi:thioredoxin 1
VLSKAAGVVLLLATLAAPVVWAQSDPDDAGDESQSEDASWGQEADSSGDEGFAEEDQGVEENSSDDEADSSEWNDESGEPADDSGQEVSDDSGDWAQGQDLEDADSNPPAEPASPVATPTGPHASETPVSAGITDATDADFDDLVLNSDVPVLVFFWAPWCGPCQTIAPTLEQLANDYAGRAKIVRVDIQDHPNLGRRFNARSIPMLLMFKDGQVHGNQIGAVGKPQLAQLIDRAL